MAAMRRLVQDDGRSPVRQSRRPLLGIVLIVATLVQACAEVPDSGSAGRVCVAPNDPVAATLIASYRAGTSQSGIPSPGAASPPSIVSFLSPDQIAASGDDLFVADQGLSQLIRVQRASQTYRPIARLPGRVSGMYVDPFRSLYLAIPAQGAVLQMSFDGTIERVFRDPTQLSTPIDVAMDRTQRLYVADGSDARVLVFDRLGQVVGTLGERVSVPNPFSTVNGIAMGSNRVYVLDSTARRIHVFASDVAVAVLELGSTVRQPTRLAVDRWERIFVADGAGARILVLEASAPERATEIGNLSGLQQINDLWIDDFGVLYVAAMGAVMAYQIPAPCR